MRQWRHEHWALLAHGAVHAALHCGVHHSAARSSSTAAPHAQLLVDCEGIDAVDQGQQHSAQIFSLAVLLSSVFVYNQVGVQMLRAGRRGSVEKVAG